MLQYYTSFFMQNIFSLRKYRVTTIGYNIFKIYIIRQKEELLFQKIIPIVWSEKSGETPEARRDVKLSSPSRDVARTANCAPVLSCKFLWSIRKTFRSHRHRAKSNRKCLFVFRQIETEKLTRNRSVRKSIHTNECQIKTGCLIYKGPDDKTVNIQRFEFKLNTIFDRISSFHETKEWILRSPFPFCLPSLNLPVSFDWAGWRQYWHCNTLLFLFSDISTFAQLTMAARGGRRRQHIRFRLPLFPRHWHLSQGSNFHFCLMFDSPRYLQYKLLVSVLIVYSGRARRGIGWEFAWLKAKYWDCGKKQDPRSQCLGSAGEKDDSEWGAGNWESFTSDHSPASRIIVGSSLSGLRRHKKPSLERREVWWDGEGEDQGPCVNISWQCLVLKIKISIRQAPLLSAMRIKFVGSVNNKKQACSLLQILNIKKSVPADWQMRKG